VSECFFLVLAHLGGPGQRAVKWFVCVGGGHNAVLMRTSPLSEVYASDAQEPASSL